MSSQTADRETNREAPGRPWMRSGLQRMRQTVASCLLFLAMLAPGESGAKETKTVFIQGNEKYEVAIQLDELGILLTEKGLHDRDSATAASGSLSRCR